MSSLFHGLVFKVANTAEREHVLAFRRKVYERDWPHVPIDQIVDRPDDAAYHLLASTDAGDIVASLRVVPSEQRPFDMERFISLDGIVPEERRPAEIGRLCVKHENRHVRSGSFVHLGMLKLAVDLSQELGITDLLLTSLPDLRNFYRLGCFREVGITFVHSTWGTVHVMRFDLVAFFDRSQDESRPVERFLKASKPSNFLL
jgi:predicted GNAT family N-acyltransferase